MECNKEEAIRAREIAEKKMQNKDFAGARKVAQKAQNLFPGLENISHMLTVCEVHCSADIKVGGEMDWYGILQVEPTADDSSIKKQYRKLALLLHPDKNQFAGAEAAFKLIGEANMILSDKTKRHLYDLKRKVPTRAICRQPAPQMRKSYHDTCTYSAVNLNGMNHQQQQPSAFATAQTFWTICPVCGMRYQYYRSILNKSLRCQNCLKTFIAYDLNANAAPSAASSHQPWNNINPHEQVQVKQGSNINQQTGNSSFTMGFKANATGGPNNDKGGSRNEGKFEKKQPREMKPEKSGKPSTENASKRRGRKFAAESSDSDGSDSDSTDIEDAAINSDDPQVKYFSSSNAPRRSTRLKQNVNYNEVVSEDDDDSINPSSHKKMRHESSHSTDGHKAGYSHVDADEFTSIDDKLKNSYNNDASSRKEQLNGSTRVDIDARGKNEPDIVTEINSGSANLPNIDSSSKASPEHGTFTYPDPEFCDFDQQRHVNKFAVNQIWSVYDNHDGMPRFYALIRQVFQPHFKMRFTWLEHNPLNDAETAWSNEELPVSCGNYVLGSSESTEDHLMFSQVVSCEKGKKKNSFNIYPRKGEIWALFKDWDIRWSSEADNHRLYEYEVIEVLSDFTARAGIAVVPLVKIEGYVSLFIRAKENPYVIPPNEILRFSHNIPSYWLTENEKGLPQGCVELDPACLPINCSESFPSISLGNVTSRVANLNVSCRPGISNVQEMQNGKSQSLSQDGVGGVSDAKQCNASENQKSDAWRHVQNDTKQTQVEIRGKDKLDSRNINDNVSEKENSSATSYSSPATYEYPEPEFHNFDEEKSIENFQRGQIWALYSDIDKFPKYYGWVKKVELDECKVHITWLEACPSSVAEESWLAKGLPISCGTFKVEGDSMVNDNTGIFSHRVETKPNTKNPLVILPKSGDIWAVYKNWSAGWSLSDLENCDYDVVEICERRDVSVKATVLTKVNGYRAVFKHEIGGKSMEIPVGEYLRFSHKIPSFKLSNERGGKLRGCYELDTASVPDILLFSDNE
ncbi:hypothetical protein Cni_G24632 [Canna indica]|uniref:J domain-containing protein n=1 Tax=Canna indica TaxID=4628 RepID=A0AAQ3L0H8_9LILI|nr:hypothetical protein Cni_G24632 [Canna indica]